MSYLAETTVYVYVILGGYVKLLCFIASNCMFDENNGSENCGKIAHDIQSGHEVI